MNNNHFTVTPTEDVSPNLNKSILLKDLPVGNRTINLAMDLTGKSYEEVTIMDFCAYCEKELRSCRYIGFKTINEIKNILQDFGLSLKGTQEQVISIDQDKAILFILQRMYDSDKISLDKTSRNFRQWLRTNRLIDMISPNSD